MITDAKPAVVGIVVADMERTLAFYRLLGLDIPAGGRHAAARRGGRFPAG